MEIEHKPASRAVRAHHWQDKSSLPAAQFLLVITQQKGELQNVWLFGRLYR